MDSELGLAHHLREFVLSTGQQVSVAFFTSLSWDLDNLWTPLDAFWRLSGDLDKDLGLGTFERYGTWINLDAM